MNIEWKNIKLPEFGVPEEIPTIPSSIYEERCRKLYEISNCKWVIVYGDREHFANLHYLTEFDPRFEEALLILGPDDKKHLLLGNEGMMYKSIVKPKIEKILCQSFSLMGQDRTISPKLEDILKEVGVSKGDNVGICGWKYLEEEEVGDHQAFFVPSFILDCIKTIVGSIDGVKDITPKLLHPVDGLRAHNEVEQIAAYEWGASRASKALWDIVKGTRPGISELEAVSNMKYAGEPLTAYLMYATGKDEIVGLRSPSGKKIEIGDGVFTALGYRGGLSCRAGLVETYNKSFLEKWAIPYFKGIVAWYKNVSVGSVAGDVYNQVSEQMKVGGLQPQLNPGHSSGVDEWLHTPFRPGSKEKIASGMAIQCDIIPEPLANGIQLNSEDPVFIANTELREKIKVQYPEMWNRIHARQKFMREVIGININDDILPLSSTPAYYAPLFLSPESVLVVK